MTCGKLARAVTKLLISCLFSFEKHLTRCNQAVESAVNTYMSENSEGLRDRLSQRGEDVLGRLAKGVIDNQALQGALKGVMGAGERVSQIHEVAMSALNLPSASDLEKLVRRVRSMSQRLEGVEDGIDRLSDKVTSIDIQKLGDNLQQLEQRLDMLSDELSGQPVND